MNTQTNIIEQVWKEHIFQGDWIRTDNISKDIKNPATGETISSTQFASIPSFE